MEDFKKKISDFEPKILKDKKIIFLSLKGDIKDILQNSLKGSNIYKTNLFIFLKKYEEFFKKGYYFYFFHPAEGHDLNKNIKKDKLVKIELNSVLSCFNGHVKIITANMIESEFNTPYLHWFEPKFTYLTVFDIDLTIPTDYKKHFLYQNFKPKSERVYLYESLMKNNLLNKCFYSWNVLNEDYPEKKENHKSISIEESFQQKDLHEEFITSDSLDFYYRNSFLSICVESEQESGVIFFTEKTLKVLINKHPFFLFSGPFYLKFLKNIGFKTFDKWWDESYDDEINLKKRIEMITKEIKILSKLNTSQLLKMRKEMDDILTHNRNHLILLKKKKPNLFKFGYLSDR